MKSSESSLGAACEWLRPKFRHFIFLAVLFFNINNKIQSQVTIWLEDFEGFANGTMVDNGSTAWSVDISSISLGQWEVENGEFIGSDTDGEGVWMSEYVDISSYSNVKVTFNLYGTGTLDAGGGNQDYMRVYYKLDNDPTEIAISSDFGYPAINTPTTCSGLSADSIQIVVRGYITGADEAYHIDDIHIFADTISTPSGPNTLFSIASGNWNNGSTWSTTSGGSACSCTPSSTSEVFIECGNNVNMNTTGNTKDITILPGASLVWTNTADLNIHGGTVTIQIGGSLDQNGETAELHFESPDSSYIVNYSSAGIDLDDIDVNAATVLTISGSGNIDLSDDFNISAKAEVINNLTGEISINADLNHLTDSVHFTNNGTITIGDDLYFNVADGTEFVNNGTVTANGDLYVNSSDGVIITNNSSGTISVLGNDVEMNNTCNNFRVNNYGTFIVEDDIINRGGGTGESWYNYANAYAYFGHNDANIDLMLYANYSGNTIDYYITANQDNMFNPQDAYWNLTLSGSGRKRTSADLDVNGDLYITASARLDPDNGNDNINLAGNWINDSDNGDPFDQGTETVTFDGAGAQTITNTNDETFYNLVINKASGEVTLNGNVYITTNGTMTFTQGIVNSSATELLIFEDNSTSNEGDADSYVSGPVKKMGNDPFVFPIGNVGRWARLAITDLQNAPQLNDEFTAEYVNGKHTESFQDSLLYLGNNGGMYNVSIVEYWDLQRNAGNTQPKVTLYWEDGDSSFINSMVDLTVAHRTAANTWVDEGGTTTGTIVTGTVTTVNNLNSFSPFTFGSGSSTVNPLPIELINFVALPSGNTVDLNWATLSEINNDYFTVERSIDGLHFEEVLKMRGAGNSTERLEYIAEDDAPYSGTSYYRLKQTDYNGDYSYSQLVAVTFDMEQEALKIYPNPISVGNALRFNTPVNGAIINTQGEVIMYLKNQKEINIPFVLPGLYFLKPIDQEAIKLIITN